VAIYHLSIKIISRGIGKSAVAAAAYRAGELITNEKDGVTHDYTRKGGIVHTEILLPTNAPAEYSDRAVLWNAVERIEKAKNSQLAREIEIALPKELTAVQNRSLVREYVKQHFVEKGMCADIAIHDTGEGNPHAHIMLTMRPFNKDGTWGDKQKKVYHFDEQGNKIYDPVKRQYKCGKVQTTDWNEHSRAGEWRAAWSEAANRYLEKLNHADRIDHRSYERHGVDQVPTIHLGAAASQMERRGIRTERGNINREIEVSNKELRQLNARLSKLHTWLKEEMANTEPPTLADVISNILERRGGAYALKSAANMLNFLTRNGIMDMAGLDDYFKGMIGERLRIGNELKPIQRRLDTLDEHIKQAEIYKQYRSYKARYDSLYAEYTTAQKAQGFFTERKAKKALDTANEYYEANRMEISLCQAAEKYLREAMQKHFDPKKLPPITKWKAEREKLIPKKNRLNREYQILKTDTAEVEKIRSNVYDIVSAEKRREQPHRAKGMEL